MLECVISSHPGWHPEGVSHHDEETPAPELGQRLRMLEGRINTLQQTLKAETGSNKVYGCGTLHALEQRHDSLQERIRTLNDEGPGFRQNVKAEIIVLADDLHAMIDSIIAPSHVAL